MTRFLILLTYGAPLLLSFRADDSFLDYKGEEVHVWLSKCNPICKTILGIKQLFIRGISRFRDKDLGQLEINLRFLLNQFGIHPEKEENWNRYFGFTERGQVEAPTYFDGNEQEYVTSDELESSYQEGFQNKMDEFKKLYQSYIRHDKHIELYDISLSSLHILVLMKFWDDACLEAKGALNSCAPITSTKWEILHNESALTQILDDIRTFLLFFCHYVRQQYVTYKDVWPFPYVGACFQKIRESYSVDEGYFVLFYI